MSDAIFYYQTYLLYGKFIYTSFMPVCCYRLPRKIYMQPLLLIIIIEGWEKSQCFIWKWMNDNEEKFLKRKTLGLPFFHLLRILQEICLKRWKREGECLKDLTAKTINIYYQDIKRRIFFVCSKRWMLIHEYFFQVRRFNK